MTDAKIIWEVFRKPNTQVAIVTIPDIQKIQADAIRWAVNLTGLLSRVTALDKADELDPPPPKKPL